jgi:hypothetical protein
VNEGIHKVQRSFYLANLQAVLPTAQNLAGRPSTPISTRGCPGWVQLLRFNSSLSVPNCQFTIAVALFRPLPTTRAPPRVSFDPRRAGSGIASSAPSVRSQRCSPPRPALRRVMPLEIDAPTDAFPQTRPLTTRRCRAFSGYPSPTRSAPHSGIAAKLCSTCATSSRDYPSVNHTWRLPAKGSTVKDVVELGYLGHGVSSETRPTVRSFVLDAYTDFVRHAAVLEARDHFVRCSVGSGDGRGW